MFGLSSKEHHHVTNRSIRSGLQPNRSKSEVSLAVLLRSLSFVACGRDVTSVRIYPDYLTDHVL